MNAKVKAFAITAGATAFGMLVVGWLFNADATKDLPGIKQARDGIS